jgi:hypothetical protein
LFRPAAGQGSRREVSAARVRGFGPGRPLIDAEIAAVDDGIDPMEKLLGKLADVPDACRPTPREIEIHSQIERGGR